MVALGALKAGALAFANPLVALVAVAGGLWTWDRRDQRRYRSDPALAERLARVEAELAQATAQLTEMQAVATPKPATARGAEVVSRGPRDEAKAHLLLKVVEQNERLRHPLGDADPSHPAL